MPQPCIWISAAETSGDIHGAQLVRSLRRLAPEARFLGVGGPEMRASGLEAQVRSEELSVMGLTEVLSALPRILRIYKRIEGLLASRRPDCLVLIDAPDFHFRIAKMAAKQGIPVYYYISPQVWAWRKRRVFFLKKHIRKILCIIPFEKDFYLRHGIDVEFVGHPLMQHLDFEALDAIPSRPEQIGIMPGSRKKEIRALLPVFAEAAQRIAAERPDTAFRLFQSAGIEEPELLGYWPQDLPVQVVPFAQRYEGMKGCGLILTASGTATLECALIGVPALVSYRVSWLSYAVAKRLVDVPFISMPNLILGCEVFPEYLQKEASGENLARRALAWLDDPEERSQVTDALATVRALLGQSVASARCAEIILEDIQGLDKAAQGQRAAAQAS